MASRRIEQATLRFQLTKKEMKRRRSLDIAELMESLPCSGHYPAGRMRAGFLSDCEYESQSAPGSNLPV